MSTHTDAIDSMGGIAAGILAAGTRSGSKRYNAARTVLQQCWNDIGSHIPACKPKVDVGYWVHDLNDLGDMRLLAAALRDLGYWLQGWEEAQARVHTSCSCAHLQAIRDNGETAEMD